MSPNPVKRWAQEGRLHRVHRHVYAVGHRSPAPEARWAAALLYCGNGAALSHRTALALHGLVAPPDTVHISLTRQVRQQPGLKVHSLSMPFQREELTRAKGLLATSVPRALLDIAAMGEPVERLVADAVARRLVSLPVLRAYVERRAGARGAARLRRCIEGRQTRSRVESEFVEWLEGHGIPIPEMNVQLGPFTVDGIWREASLVLEIDTFATHGTLHSFENDRLRDAYCAAHGHRTIRVTPNRWRNDSKRLARDILRSLSHS